MNKKISLVALLLAVVLLVPLVNADFTPGAVNCYVWVDKTQYNPGEAITLYFTILNARSSDIMINQVDIKTPWFMYIKDQWEGNQTMIINKVVTAGSAYSNSTIIPIPSDGRATTFNSSAEIDVAIETNIGTFNEPVAVGMANQPFTVRDMDTLVLLSAVLIILIVVCTALIAAAIFLSARKPQEVYPPAPSSQSTP